VIEQAFQCLIVLSSVLGVLVFKTFGRVCVKHNW